jgi:hypothetical protein
MRMLQCEPNKKLVYEWRQTSWNPSDVSKCTITFEDGKDGPGSTKVRSVLYMYTYTHIHTHIAMCPLTSALHSPLSLSVSLSPPVCVCVCVRARACTNTHTHTQVTLKQTGIPYKDAHGNDDMPHVVKEGWKRNFFDRIKMVFGFGSPEFS